MSLALLFHPFTAQHVSNVSTSIFRSLRLTVDLYHGLYCSGSMCVGVTVWFGWGGVVSLCRLKLCLSLHKDMQGIYTYIPETNCVPREYSVATILLLLFMVLISLVSVLNRLYFYISSFPKCVCSAQYGCFL